MVLRSPRISVGIVLVNKEKKVFIGKRSYIKDDKYWQMPQGGVEANEKLEDAAKRELSEETGIKQENMEIIAISKNWYTYEIPQEYCGKHFNAQTQKWFLILYNGDELDIDVNQEKPEFSSWKWENFKKLAKLVIDFKKDVYKQVFKDFQWYFEK